MVARIDPVTGLLSAPSSEGIEEVFLDGTAPTESAAAPGEEANPDQMLLEHTKGRRAAVYLSAVVGIFLDASRLRPRSYPPTSIPDKLLPARARTTAASSREERLQAWLPQQMASPSIRSRNAKHHVRIGFHATRPIQPVFPGSLSGRCRG